MSSATPTALGGSLGKGTVTPEANARPYSSGVRSNLSVSYTLAFISHAHWTAYASPNGMIYASCPAESTTGHQRIAAKLSFRFLNVLPHAISQNTSAGGGFVAGAIAKEEERGHLECKTSPPMIPSTWPKFLLTGGRFCDEDYDRREVSADIKINHLSYFPPNFCTYWSSQGAGLLHCLYGSLLCSWKA